MSNIVIVLILVGILGAASAYVIRAKKTGRKCIGCPEGCCPSAGNTKHGDSMCACCCGCSKDEEN